MSFDILNLKPFNEEINTLTKVKAEFDFKLDNEIDELVENPDFKSSVLRMYKAIDENILKDLHHYLENEDVELKGAFCYYYITEMGMSQSKVCAAVGLSTHYYRELRDQHEAEWKKFAIELKNCEIQEHTAYLAYTTIWNFINIDNILVDLDLDFGLLAEE
ncbi:hypothetical protein MSBR3_1570 [Methanosarcina barkeri 3]|uniref:Uncharacterized protein n=1 Tax=Methanosarcina barkeri 3 TaxID=1434107 RepID=A0A0E3SMI6_METBA|nr:hypothetical protein [Methanosarcina barkeri]AKB82148.1 hypothetical protein MSBR3_1570 [Methanosarcina barkeri 3]